MEMRRKRPLRDGLVALLVVAALLWLIVVVPFFVVGTGFSGGTVADGLSVTWRNAAAGDFISLSMVALTMSLVGLPWAIWVLWKER